MRHAMRVDRSFFEGLFSEQSLLNLAYLLLAFPLALTYFTVLFASLALGLALFVVLLGVPVILYALALTRVAARFERALARRLLGVEIPDPRPRAATPARTWERLVADAGDPATIRSAIFLYMKFPIGVVSFVVSSGVLSITTALLTAPLTYRSHDLAPAIGTARIDTPTGALIALAAAPVAAVVGLRLTNALAAASGRFAVHWLGPGPEPLPAVARAR